MNQKINWHNLLSRLLRDIDSRESTDPQNHKDDEAWIVLYKLIQECGVKYFHRFKDQYSSDNINDIIHIIYIKLQSRANLKRLLTSSSPKGYLYVMIKNESLNLHRKYKKERDLLNKARPAISFNSNDLVVYKSRLLREIDKLTPTEKRILKLRFWHGYSIDEIAKDLKLTYSAAAVTIFRLLRKLRRRIKSLNNQ